MRRKNVLRIMLSLNTTANKNIYCVQYRLLLVIRGSLNGNYSDGYRKQPAGGGGLAMARLRAGKGPRGLRRSKGPPGRGKINSDTKLHKELKNNSSRLEIGEKKHFRDEVVDLLR